MDHPRRKLFSGNVSKGLISWTQERCKICQRFLGDHQILYCNRCKEKMNKRNIKRYKETHPDQVRKDNKLYQQRHLEKWKEYNRKAYEKRKSK